MLWPIHLEVMICRSRGSGSAQTEGVGYSEDAKEKTCLLVVSASESGARLNAHPVYFLGL